MSYNKKRSSIINSEKRMNEVINWHETPVRVRYVETDKMGIVYHANYLIWFEIGRTEYCRARGFAYREMEEDDQAFLVVVESYCRYKSPAYYDDDLIVRTHVAELRKRSLRFGYEIVRPLDNVLIAEGETTHLITDVNSRVISFPEHYRQMLLASVLPEASEFPKDIAPS
jgi:acyl-CoA thioester hydrolase